jgi:circadian clock protein KaiB
MSQPSDPTPPATSADSDAGLPADTYVLVLYVAGSTARSLNAIENARAICEEVLEGRYRLEIVDIYRDLALASRDDIVAVPTLLKKLPLPLRQIIGDLSERERVLVGLDLRS